MITGNDSPDNDQENQNEILVSGSNSSSKRDAGNTFSDESEVIELTDIVRKEARPDGYDASSGLSEQKMEGFAENRTEIDLDELTKEMEILSENMPDHDGMEDSLSSSDFDFETHEESYTETSAEFPDEDLEEIMSKLEQEGRTGTPLIPLPGKALPGMTEERMEALIREVVEKAVRDTMARVAEKVITEAIESLRESLKP